MPDVPLEELDPWEEAARQAGIETILLAAPTADDARLERICARASGFVYGVGLLGVTGERSELAESATTIAGRLKAITDLPVLVGRGSVDARAGGPSVRGRPTGSWSDRPWCGVCSKDVGRSAPPGSSANCARHWTVRHR